MPVTVGNPIMTRAPARPNCGVGAGNPQLQLTGGGAFALRLIKPIPPRKFNNPREGFAGTTFKR